MSTIDERRATAEAGVYDSASSNGFGTRVVLTPIAAPSILGLYGFAGATFIVAAHLAGWYGSARSGLYLFPFAAMFGGLAQFVAGMWAYRARDAVATAMHGMWGSFWLAYGVLNLLFAAKTLTEPTPTFDELGFWFIALGAITAVGAIAVYLEGNPALMAVLGTLALGCACAAIAYMTAGTGWDKIAGYVFIVAAVLAFYVASAMMLAAAAGRVVIPLGKVSAAANTPGRRPQRAIELEWGEPGVKRGQ
jgi:succinate-acetate transporter protein